MTDAVLDTSKGDRSKSPPVSQYKDISALLQQISNLQADHDILFKQREETESYYKNLLNRISQGRETGE